MCSVCDMHSLFCLFISCSVEQVPDVCVSSAGLQLLSAASRRLCGMCHYHRAPATIHFRLPALRFADLCVLFSTTQVQRLFVARTKSSRVGCCLLRAVRAGAGLATACQPAVFLRATIDIRIRLGDGRRTTSKHAARRALRTRHCDTESLTRIHTLVCPETTTITNYELI